MKTRFLILAVLTSLIFIACQKEDESENPYNTATETKSYFFTDTERSLILYNKTDSFTLQIDGYQDNKYYVLEKKEDTLVNSESIKYAETYIRFKKVFYGGVIDEVGFLYISKKYGTLDYRISLVRKYYDVAAVNSAVSNIKTLHDSLKINGITYENVYELGDSNKDKWAYVSVEKGIIAIHEFGQTQYLIP